MNISNKVTPIPSWQNDLEQDIKKFAKENPITTLALTILFPLGIIALCVWGVRRATAEPKVVEETTTEKIVNFLQAHQKELTVGFVLLSTALTAKSLYHLPYWTPQLVTNSFNCLYSSAWEPVANATLSLNPDVISCNPLVVAASGYEEISQLSIVGAVWEVAKYAFQANISYQFVRNVVPVRLAVNLMNNVRQLGTWAIYGFPQAQPAAAPTPQQPQTTS